MDMKTESQKKPDRLLGDEWQDWTGDLDESKNYQETARLFTVYAILALMVILVALAFTLYMIEPRLLLINQWLVYLARILTISFILISALWGGLLVASVFTGKNLIFHSRLGQVTASRILPFALALARRLGISRDRLGNSFIIFSNAIVRASHKPGRGKTIILLPRCLKAEIKKEVQELADLAGVKVFTATGGGSGAQHYPRGASHSGYRCCLRT